MVKIELLIDAYIIEIVEKNVINDEHTLSSSVHSVIAIIKRENCTLMHWGEKCTQNLATYSFYLITRKKECKTPKCGGKVTYFNRLKGYSDMTSWKYKMFLLEDSGTDMSAD